MSGFCAGGRRPALNKARSRPVEVPHVSFVSGASTCDNVGKGEDHSLLSPINAGENTACCNAKQHRVAAREGGGRHAPSQAGAHDCADRCTVPRLRAFPLHARQMVQSRCETTKCYVVCMLLVRTSAEVRCEAIGLICLKSERRAKGTLAR